MSKDIDITNKEVMDGYRVLIIEDGERGLDKVYSIPLTRLKRMLMEEEE